MSITIKAARVNAGLTQMEVAKKLKISKNTVVSYEQYRTSPDIATAEKLAALFGLPVNGIKWALE